MLTLDFYLAYYVIRYYIIEALFNHLKKRVIYKIWTIFLIIIYKIM